MDTISLLSRASECVITGLASTADRGAPGTRTCSRTSRVSRSATPHRCFATRGIEGSRPANPSRSCPGKFGLGAPALLSLRKKPGIRPTVSLTDGNGKVLGTFKIKLFSLGGGFTVADALGNQFAEVSRVQRTLNLKSNAQ